MKTSVTKTKKSRAKTPEETLKTLNARSEREEARLESLTTRHEKTLKERAVLTYIVRREQLDRSGQGLRKSIIRWQEVRSFMEHASQMFDQLQHKLHISLRYAWFCQWLCTQYSFCRQRGGGSSDVLSPHTVLSYFKRERAGG